MTRVVWDTAGQHVFETGVDRGVLYIPTNGVYDHGYAWSGLTTITENPSGAAATSLYADNQLYLNLLSAEKFAADIEAYTYPDQWAQCDGSAEPVSGVYVGQQTRHPFGLSYRTKVGNDSNPEAGYKLHLVWGATAAPSQKAYATVNDNPSALAFKWTISTVPVAVSNLKPTAIMVIDSTKVPAGALSTLEDFLYGTAGTNPSLPTPDAVIAIFNAAITQATPTAPSYVQGTGVITIPNITGVIYYTDGGGDMVSGAQPPISTSTVVKARPAVGYKFPAVTDTDWLFIYP